MAWRPDRVIEIEGTLDRTNWTLRVRWTWETGEAGCDTYEQLSTEELRQVLDDLGITEAPF